MKTNKTLVILTIVFVLSVLMSACGTNEIHKAASDVQNTTTQLTSDVKQIQDACSGDLLHVLTECAQTANDVLPNDN